VNTKAIENYLNSFGRQVVKESQELLQKQKGSTSLGESIRFTVTKEDGGFSTKFYMEDYGKFLDKGVSGNEKKQSYTNYDGKKLSSPGKGYTTKHPPTGILEKWIKRKGLKGRDKKSGRFITNKSFAFAIAKSIQKKGIKSLSFFQKPFGLRFKELEKDFLKILTIDIRSNLVEFYRPK
jgi:hypothetical protein|tara:strand:+ start:397 stop:933 length:537 start_codon:yes stop_codon:yes gene_type:complete